MSFADIADGDDDGVSELGEVASKLRLGASFGVRSCFVVVAGATAGEDDDSLEMADMLSLDRTGMCCSGVEFSARSWSALADVAGRDENESSEPGDATFELRHLDNSCGPRSSFAFVDVASGNDDVFLKLGETLSLEGKGLCRSGIACSVRSWSALADVAGRDMNEFCELGELASVD